MIAPVPDCYYVCSSDPAKTAADIRACVAKHGAPGEVSQLKTSGKKVRAEVHYADFRDAVRVLEPVKNCIEEKGHTVHDYGIVYGFDEVGLASGDDSGGDSAA